MAGVASSSTPRGAGWWRRVLLAVVVGALAGGCRGPGRASPGHRTYFAGYLGPLDRQQTGADPISDAFLLGAAMGEELSSGPVRPAFEIDGSWSYHDVDFAGATDDANVTIARIGVGARLSVDLPYVTPYVRAGGFYRWDGGLRRKDGLDTRGPDIESQSGRGYYYGGGIEFWVDGVGSIGPTATWFEGTGDQGVDELFIGLMGHTHF